jgi:hypothetical protein
MPAKVKFRPDTPVTMQMLADMHREYGHLKSAEWIESHIEQPKPEPNDGELWLCILKKSVADRIALWKTLEGWTVYQSGASEPWSTDEIVPLKRLIPAEDEE